MISWIRKSVKKTKPKAPEPQSPYPVDEFIKIDRIEMFI